MSATIFTALLRAPERVAEDCLHDRELPAIVRTSLAAIVLGAALFGGTLGTFRGREQILFAALKVPLALLATLAISAPAFHALAARANARRRADAPRQSVHPIVRPSPHAPQIGAPPCRVKVLARPHARRRKARPESDNAASASILPTA